jgi:hypothetical protein
MARLQVLELPEGTDDERPPFVLVVDQCVPQRIALGADAPYRDYWQDLAQQIGARGVIVTPETVDIPANDTTAYLGDREVRSEVTVKLGDQDVRSAISAGMNKARQQAGLPTVGQRLADERTNIARDMDRLAKWKLQILDALGMNHSRDWDDIRNTAAGIRKQRDAQVEAIERVRQLHQAVDYRGTVICRECSGYGGQSTDNAPVDHDKCGTLLALAGERPAAHRDITVDNAAEVVASHDPSRRA